MNTPEPRNFSLRLALLFGVAVAIVFILRGCELEPVPAIDQLSAGVVALLATLLVPVGVIVWKALSVGGEVDIMLGKINVKWGKGDNEK